MAPGITRDPRGTQDTPPSGIRSIDAQVTKLQAQDAKHLAALSAQAKAAKR